MRTLTLQKNRNLLLAGILAFAFLLATQIAVNAQDFVGGMNSVKTIGGYGILTIGNPLFDTSLNIGAPPIVVTLPASGVFLDNVGTHATLNADLTDMGESTNLPTFFQWGSTVAYGHLTPTVNQVSTGTFTSTITGFAPNFLYHYRVVTYLDSIYVYGDDQIFNTSGISSQTGNTVFGLNQVALIMLEALGLIYILKMFLNGQMSPIMAMIMATILIYLMVASITGLNTTLNEQIGS